jgi:hypothetical protein
MGMKHLASGIAIAAGIAIASPVWAQQYNPAAPGATGVGAPMPAPAPPTSSATPPVHHAVRHVMHHKGMAKPAAVTGDTTAQLNREELSRIQAGNFSNPPAPPAPGPMPSH